MDPHDRYLPIGDYAIIGDCQTAALVSRFGSIDWLCVPQFDSHSIFASILDADRGGHFRIEPVGRYEAERRYLDETVVLETTFTTDQGVLRLTDLFTVADRGEYIRRFRPEHEILRILDCVEGQVEVEVEFMPRPDYARRVPSLVAREDHGFFHTHMGHLLMLRADVPVKTSDEDSVLSGSTVMREGERRYMSLAFDREGPAVMPILGRDADVRLEQTIRYWRGWSQQCTYDGPHREPVLRSALTLKLLSYAESGAIVAAPTTSLPEHIGGERNWDYRYCWLRDASLTLRSFMDLGFRDEAKSFLAWLTFVTRRALPDVHILYNVHGNVEMHEQELPHLEGYRGSRPVRVGNDARGQFQLDVYGEVVSACFDYVEFGGRLDKWQRRLLRMLGRTICRRWEEPDNGIWEDRTNPAHHTYSKLMCWVGLDRLVRLGEKGAVKLPLDRMRRVREEIRDAIEQRGYNADLQTFVSTLDGSELDATLLLLPFYGFIPADDERMIRTYDTIRETLGRGSLLYRYPPDGRDGLPPGEGAFGLCGFWGVEYLAHAGRIDEAEEAFHDLVGYSNDLGLFAEEIDPDSGAALGNFPQAFTHIGVINAAVALDKARGEQKPAEGEHRWEDRRVTS